MPVPIRPEEIHTPDDDPFKNDLLDRKKTAQVLTEVLRSFRGPGVVALDAPWGAGKTTFLKMWKRHLRTSGFAVIEYNAWETDFAEDPFLALSTELHAGIASSGIDVPRRVMHRIREATQQVVRQGLRELLRSTASSVPVVGGIAGTVAESALASLADARVSGYTKRKDAFQSFQESIRQVASTVSENTDGKPIVVIIDELDRCRPTYAVELLEVAKHLFSVDHVVFVLGINRPQLAHSVRALYGSGFDAPHYLNRFIDAVVHLPETDRRTFIESAIKGAGIYDTLDSLKDAAALEYIKTAFATLRELFRISDVDARTTLSCINRLGLVLGSVPQLGRSIIWTSTVVSLIMAHDANVYRELCRAEISDSDVIDAVRKRCRTTDWTNTHETRYFEEFVIRLVKDQSGGRKPDPRQRQESEYGALLAHLGGDPAKTEEEKRARDILGYVQEEGARGEGGSRTRISTDFSLVAARFDLLSGSAPFE